MVDAAELDQICRLCLVNKGHDRLKVFFVITEDQKEMFEALTDFELPLLPSLPTNICPECSDQLEKFFVYKKQLIRNQKGLLQHLDLSEKLVKEELPKPESVKYAEEEEDCLEENTENGDKEFEMEAIDDDSAGSETQESEEKIEEAVPRINDIEEQYSEEQPKLVLTPNFLKAREAIKLNPPQESSTPCEYLPATLISNDTEEFVYICNKCDNIEFTSEAEAKMHINDHKFSAGGQACEFCQMVFKTRLNYEKHVDAVHNNMKFVCQVCGKVSDSRIQHRSHMRNHDQTLRYPCPVDGCTKAFRVKHHLNNHLRVHNKDSPFECTYEGCSAKFRQKHALTIHLRKHTGDYVICDSCKSPFVTQFQLNKHSKSCNGTYKPLLTRTQRSETTRKNSRDFSCSEGCSKSFKSKAELELHVSQSHPAAAESIFENRLTTKSHQCANSQATCSICNFCFKDEESLSNHMVDYHETDEL